MIQAAIGARVEEETIKAIEEALEEDIVRKEHKVSPNSQSSNRVEQVEEEDPTMVLEEDPVAKVEVPHILQQ